MKCIMLHLWGINVIIGEELGLVFCWPAFIKGVFRISGRKCPSTKVWHPSWMLVGTVFKTSKKKSFSIQQVVNLGSPHHGCYSTKTLCGLKGWPGNDSAALKAWGCNVSNPLPLPSSESNPNNQESNEKQEKKVWELISNENFWI